MQTVLSERAATVRLVGQQLFDLADEVERPGHTDETVGRRDLDGAGQSGGGGGGGVGGRGGGFEPIRVCVLQADLIERVERGGAWVGRLRQNYVGGDRAERGDHLITLLVVHRAEEERDGGVDKFIE